ncbi:unnamed protein product [Albugo candida]|uniref:Uncharacterized protein n=1 Tax=Albugo candida TaxID=65357 RepID=A0A024FTK6_9STRA|nr:unnamed protein product [Albugo candida]|eukprot:CCI10267.1 unnamed protein product [Albugo candida]
MPHPIMQMCSRQNVFVDLTQFCRLPVILHAGGSVSTRFFQSYVFHWGDKSKIRTTLTVRPTCSDSTHKVPSIGLLDELVKAYQQMEKSHKHVGVVMERKRAFVEVGEDEDINFKSIQ